MSSSGIQAGDRARIIDIPDWLLRDLPEEDQQRLKAQQGQVVTVLKLMPHGFLSFADGSDGLSLQPSNVQAESQ